MACGCRDKKRRSGESGLKHIVRLAEAFSKTSEQDTEVYIEGLYNRENLYNFAPLGSNRGQVVKEISWQVKE